MSSLLTKLVTRSPELRALPSTPTNRSAPDTSGSNPARRKRKLGFSGSSDDSDETPITKRLKVDESAAGVGTLLERATSLDVDTAPDSSGQNTNICIFPGCGQRLLSKAHTREHNVIGHEWIAFCKPNPRPAAEWTSFPCIVCAKVFPSRRIIMLHYSQHDDSSHKFDERASAFALTQEQDPSLIASYDNSTVQGDTIMCEYPGCGKRLRNQRRAIEQHKSFGHEWMAFCKPNPLPAAQWNEFPCAMCPKVYKSKSSLIIHARLHNYRSPWRYGTAPASGKSRVSAPRPVPASKAAVPWYQRPPRAGIARLKRGVTFTLDAARERGDPFERAFKNFFAGLLTAAGQHGQKELMSEWREFDLAASLDECGKPLELEEAVTEDKHEDDKCDDWEFSNLDDFEYPGAECLFDAYQARANYQAGMVNDCQDDGDLEDTAVGQSGGGIAHQNSIIQSHGVAEGGSEFGSASLESVFGLSLLSAASPSWAQTAISDPAQTPDQRLYTESLPESGQGDIDESAIDPSLDLLDDDGSEAESAVGNLGQAVVQQKFQQPRGQPANPNRNSVDDALSSETFVSLLNTLRLECERRGITDVNSLIARLTAQTKTNFQRGLPCVLSNATKCTSNLVSKIGRKASRQPRWLCAFGQGDIIKIFVTVAEPSLCA
ncbi:hypothetical protein BKA62DRAFT_696208 [Auriculariales sp. MPI-PUGE-AT-0066]|nr:hypothetical protein BKA62DRAFT_696208 [Auriculariales sp. MPI-PUGE-AT-0066]